MRTTIDLPDDLHRAATLVARDRQQTLSRTVADLLRTALQSEVGGGSRLERDPRTGFLLARLPPGVVITDEDVASLDDEE